MRKPPLVSVIVPAYNVEQYLERCINSIIEQTYTNIEILILNDGSTDSTGRIIDKYVESFDNIVPIHKENEGIGKTRNRGLDVASGEFLFFVDSDDYIESCTIEFLVNEALKQSAEIVCCNKYRVYENSGKCVEEHGYETLVLDKKKALEFFLFTEYVDVVFWNKLIKRELFDGVRCPDHIYEDVCTVYKLIDRANRIVCIDKPLYYYCERKESITEKKFSQTTYLLKDAIDENYRFITNKYNDLRSDMNVARIRWYMVIYNKMMLSDYKDLNFVKELRTLIHKGVRDIWKSKKISNQRKFQYMLFKHSLLLYKLSYKVFLKLKR